MGKYFGLVVVGALLLTGCGGAAQAVSEPVDKDAQYIEAVRPVLDEFAGMPDWRLLELSVEFCEQAEDGITIETMREGARDFNTPVRADEFADMAEVAVEIYCPTAPGA